MIITNHTRRMLLLAIMMIPLGMGAQELRVSQGAHLVLTGAVQLVLEDAGFSRL